MDTKSYCMSSLLMQSVLQSDIGTSEELLKRGANPNLVLSEGATPFHIAAGSAEHSQAFTKLLLQYGGNPNVMSVEGVTPLHVACVYDHCDATRLLLVGKGDPLLHDNEGQNAFDYAENSGCKICRCHLYHYSGVPMPPAAQDGETKAVVKRRSQRSFYTSQIQTLLNEFDPEKHIIDVTSPDHPQLLDRVAGDRTFLRLDACGSHHPSSPDNPLAASQNDVTTDSGLDVHSPCESEKVTTHGSSGDPGQSCEESPTASENYHSFEDNFPAELEQGILQSVSEASVISPSDSSVAPELVSIDTPPGEDLGLVDTVTSHGISCDSLENDTFLRSVDRLHAEVQRMQRGSFSSVESSVDGVSHFPTVGLALNHSNDAHKSKLASQPRGAETCSMGVQCDVPVKDNYVLYGRDNLSGSPMPEFKEESTESTGYTTLLADLTLEDSVLHKQQELHEYESSFNQNDKQRTPSYQKQMKSERHIVSENNAVSSYDSPFCQRKQQNNGRSHTKSTKDCKAFTTWKEVSKSSPRVQKGWTSPCPSSPRTPPRFNLQKKLESLQSDIFSDQPEMTLDDSGFERHCPTSPRYAVRSSEKIPNKSAPASPFKDSGISSIGRFSPRKNQTSANNPLFIQSPSPNITDDLSSDQSKISLASHAPFYLGHGPRTSSRNNTSTGSSVPYLSSREISAIRLHNAGCNTSSLAISQCSCSSVRTVEHVVRDAEGSFLLVENHYPVDDALSPCAHGDPALACADMSMDSTILYWDDLASPSAAPSDSMSRPPTTIPSDIQELGNPALRAQLEAMGDLPGPITHTTRKLYEKRLFQLRSDPAMAAANQKKAQQGYPTELSNALKGALDISSLQDLEDAMCQPFLNPDPMRHWREGVSKTSLNYLLLDPRITCNLPNRVKSIGTEESFCTFVKAIFYVGKGKRSRPYAHFKEAMQQHNNPRKQASRKVSHILSIWGEDLGVISLHLFQSVIPVEAYTREAAMIAALGLHRLSNVKSGDFYGPSVTWNGKQRRLLGVRLLQKAFRIFLSEGERQIKPGDILTQ